jgi:hypothetical protein
MPNAKDFFYDLHDAGYVIFSKEANFPNGGGGVEFGFLKLKPTFFINNTLYKPPPLVEDKDNVVPHVQHVQNLTS